MVCEACSRIAVPPLDAWPQYLGLWLVGQQMAAFFAPHLHGTAQRRYERLLVSVIAGKTWSGQVVPRAVSLEDAYQIALREATKWKEAGMPDLY